MRNRIRKKKKKFDEKEYQRYEDTRSKFNLIFDDAAEIHKNKIQVATPDELDCIETAYEISVKMKNDDDRPISSSYFTLDEAIRNVQKTKDEIPFPKAQPKRFTVHASADPSNPYNEVIDYEDMDALNQGVGGNTAEGGKKDKDSSKHKSSLKKSSRDKPQQPTNQAKRPALVVQQLPPPMLLPPETFEKTVKAIPDKLYTDFIPATVVKKPEKKEKSSSKKSHK